jgi:hypothetical protein
MTHLTPGDPAPWFTARTPLRPDFLFGSVAGRPLVLSFIGSAGLSPGKAMLDGLLAARAQIDPARLFIVSQDGEDEAQGRIAALYGLTTTNAAGQPARILASFVLDLMLRIVAVVPFNDPQSHTRAVLEALAVPAAPGPAPALLLPRIFEPEFCRALIALHDGGDATDSGFMRTDPATGMTVLTLDHRLKRRSDCV